MSHRKFERKSSVPRGPALQDYLQELLVLRGTAADGLVQQLAASKQPCCPLQR